MPWLYVGSDGDLVASVGAPGPIKTSLPVDDGAWHYLVFTVSSTSETLYLDGKLVGASTPHTDSVDEDDIYVGTGFIGNGWADEGNSGNTTATPLYFKGDISDVALWTSTLSDETATSLYTAAKNSQGVAPVESVTVGDPGSSSVSVPFTGTSYAASANQTWTGSNTHVVFQNDGNLVVRRNDTDAALWASNTSGYPSATLSFQGDGNLVIYNGSTPLWASGTAGATGDTAFLTAGGDFEIDAGQGQRLWDTATNLSDAVDVDTYQFDPLNGDRMVAETDARGYTTTYGYDTSGFLNTVTDPNGNVTTTQHDVRGNETAETTCQDTATDACSTKYWTYYPDDTSVQLATPSPENDQQLTYRDPRSSSSTDATYETTYTYNTCGERTGVTTPPVAGYSAGLTTTTVYTTGSSSTTCGQAQLAHGSTTQYAPAGLVAQTSTPGGAITTYQYDAAGDLYQETSPLGETTTYTYDGLGRVVSKTVGWSATYPGASTTSGSATTTYTYTADGQLYTETDPIVTDAVADYTHQKVTTYTYTPDGLTTQVTVSDAGDGADTARTTFTHYNTDDQVESVTDPAGDATSYKYDAFGRKQYETDPDGNEEEYTYDADGNLIETDLLDYTGNPNNPSAATTLVLESRSYDPADRLATVTDAMGRITTYTYTDNGLVASVQVGQGTWQYTQEADSYDAAGELTEQVTDNGVTETEWTYDADGRKLTEVEDPTGVDRSTAFSYTADGDVSQTQTTAAASSMTLTDVYTYDVAGDIKTQTLSGDGKTRVTTWTYDTRGLALTMENPASQVTTYVYDALGQCTETEDASITVTTFAPATLTATSLTANPTTLTGYNTFGETADVQDPDGNITTWTLDGDGRITEIQGSPYTPYSPNSSATQITPIETRTYDGDGNLKTDVSPNNETTSYLYDQLGDAVKVTDGAGNATTYTFDVDKEELSSTSPTGTATSATYDPAGRQITSSVYESALSQTLTTTYAYGASGTYPWVETVTTPAGVATGYTYDDIGEKLTDTDGAGNVTTYAYDGFGHTAKTTYADHTYVTDTYDAIGDLLTTTVYNAAGTVQSSSSATYTLIGEVASATNPLDDLETFSSYNALGLPTGETQPVTSSTSINITFGYDLDGNETDYTDGNGNSTYYTWNSLGQQDTKTVPATSAYSGKTNQVTGYIYNADGELTGEDLPGSVTQAMTYDADGNLLTQTGSGASATTLARVFTYNGSSELTMAQTCADTTCGTVDSSESYTYNSEGELATATSTTGPANSSSFTYNTDGLMASRTDASGTSTYTYDTADRLLTDQDAASGQELTYSYNDMDQLARIAYSGGDTRTFGYDALGRLTSDEVENSSGARVGEIDYGYNAASEPTSMDEYGIGTASANTETTNGYTYDEAGELTSWTATPAGGSATTVTYGYDGAGNRTSVNGTTYSYDQRDELLSNGTDSYTYTADGTVATSTVTATDLEGTYTSDAYGQQITAGSSTYTYDALGRVLTSGATTLDYSGQDNTVASDGTTTYSRDPDGTVTGVDSTTLGASTAWTDQHTDLVATFASGASSLGSWTVYDPLGNVTATSGTQTSLGYQSEYTDPATGQVNMDARWYSPSEGQFTSADTINNNPVPDPDAANPYTYVDASPVGNTDSSGHCAWCVAALGFSGADDWNPTGWILGAGVGLYLGLSWASQQSWAQTNSSSGTQTTSSTAATSFGDYAPTTSCVMNSYQSWLETCPGAGAAAPPTATSSSAAAAGSAGSSSGGGGYICDSACQAARAAAQAAFAAAASKMGRVASTISTAIGTNPATRPGAASGIAPIARNVAAAATGAVATAAFCSDFPQACSDDNSGRSCDANDNTWIEYDPTGPGGRSEGAEACLTDMILGQGSDVTNNARDKTPGYQDVVDFANAHGGDASGRINDCHLIASLLGGSGSDIENLFPCSRATNTYVRGPGRIASNMRTFEASLVKLVEAGEVIDYKVNLSYSGSAVIPVAAELSAACVAQCVTGNNPMEEIVPNSLYVNGTGMVNLGLLP